MEAVSDRPLALIERLQAAHLMPPIKSVETRLAAAIGSMRWKLVEMEDDRATGVEFRAAAE